MIQFPDKRSPYPFLLANRSATIGSASCDVLGAEVSAATLSLAAATYTDKMLIFEVDVSNMDVANGENWLTAALSNAANSGADCVAILEPRYTRTFQRRRLRSKL